MNIEDATKYLRLACQQLGQAYDVEVTKIDGFRWTVTMKRPEVMIRVEKLLQETLHKPIDLRLPRVSDKNKREQRNVLNGPKQSGS